MAEISEMTIERFEEADPILCPRGPESILLHSDWGDNYDERTILKMENDCLIYESADTYGPDVSWGGGTWDYFEIILDVPNTEKYKSLLNGNVFLESLAMFGPGGSFKGGFRKFLDDNGIEYSTREY